MSRAAGRPWASRVRDACADGRRVPGDERRGGPRPERPRRLLRGSVAARDAVPSVDVDAAAEVYQKHSPVAGCKGDADFLGRCEAPLGGAGGPRRWPGDARQPRGRRGPAGPSAPSPPQGPGRRPAPGASSSRAACPAPLVRGERAALSGDTPRPALRRGRGGRAGPPLRAPGRPKRRVPAPPATAERRAGASASGPVGRFRPSDLPTPEPRTKSSGRDEGHSPDAAPDRGGNA